MIEALHSNDVFEFEDCLLVIPQREPRLFLLNPIARTMWEDLARGVPLDALASGLAARFGVPAARVQADVDAMLAEWRAHRLLAPAPSPPAAPVGAAAAAAPSSKLRSFRSERVYAPCGRSIRLRFEAPEIEQVFDPPLAHTTVPSGQASDSIDVVPDDAGGYLIVCNGSDIERAATLEEALGQVFGRILELSYPDAEWLAVLHAAAVGDGGEGAVIMAGGSGSGKSTLTAALVDAGLSYFSDDMVPLDEALRIRPMPLGISVKEGSWPVLAPRYPELEALPIHAGRRRRYLPIDPTRTGPGAGLAVKALIFPQYRPDQPTVVQPLTRLQVLERLTRAQSWMSLDRRRFDSTLRWIERTPGYELSHASLAEGMAAIERLMAAEPIPSAR